MSEEIVYTGSNDDEVLETLQEWFPAAEIAWGASRPGVRNLIIDGVTKGVPHGATLARGVHHVFIDGDDS